MQGTSSLYMRCDIVCTLWVSLVLYMLMPRLQMSRSSRSLFKSNVLPPNQCDRHIIIRYVHMQSVVYIYQIRGFVSPGSVDRVVIDELSLPNRTITITVRMRIGVRTGSMRDFVDNGRECLSPT